MDYIMDYDEYPIQKSAIYSGPTFPIDKNDPGITDPMTLDYAIKKCDQLDRMISFLELENGITADSNTEYRIREFLIKEGIWK